MGEGGNTPRQSSGNTGFLFGNIDSRGRLDEDYMDDDAKDQLDNVAPTVADRDPNLREITAAVPRGSAPDAVVDDRGSPTEHADAAEDYYDETEVMEDLDPEEREALASRALAAARGPIAAGPATAGSDDENYDDDDDDTGASGKAPQLPPLSIPSAVGAPRASPVPSPLASPSPSPALSPPPGDGAAASSTGMMMVDASRPGAPAPPPLVRFSASQAAAAQAKIPSLGAVGVNAEERMQLELMEAAKKSAANPSVGESVQGSEMPGSLAFAGRLRFSEVLALPPKKLPAVSRRKRYGVRPVCAQTVSILGDDGADKLDPVCAADDSELLNTAPPPVKVDPVKLFLKSDRVYDGQRQKSNGFLPTSDDYVNQPPILVDEDDGDAFGPLMAPSEGLAVRQNPSNGEVGPDLRPAQYSMLQQMSWEAEIQWDNPGDSEEESVDDEGDVAAPMDTATTTANEKKGPGAGSEDDDDDDDMEWEDGNVATAVDASPSPDPVAPPPIVAPPAKEPAPSASKPPLGPPTASKATPCAPSKKVDHSLENDKGAATKPASSAVVTYPIVEGGVRDPLICTVLQRNRNLAECDWLHDIAWDSSDVDSDISAWEDTSGHRVLDLSQRRRPRHRNPASRTDRLILDMNDHNLVLEEVDSYDPKESFLPHRVKSTSVPVADGDADGASVRAELARMALLDPFNVSNDAYYARGFGNSMLKLGRREILRGLRNAPPAVKAQTTEPCTSEIYLDAFHRPRFCIRDLSRKQFELQPFRRKRPKGGSSQIAGQVPKKQGELLVSAKDAYRVCLFEFALEASPSLVAIPGMASKVVTYDRKASAAAASQARKDATGTPDADTVFLAPEEMPPLHAGDLAPDAKPLNVLESHLFSAPCTRQEAATSDFLVVRRKDKMYVREIDSVLSVGVTEPKVEVMAPNSDRFKKYSRDRVSLWLLRELLKNQKNPKNTDGSASIERDNLFDTFPRRRSFPETSLGKLLKELSKYHNGKYVLIPEPPKGFAAMEAEWLRAVTPEETCAFEAMDAGWHRLIRVGIQKLTHPNHTGIRAAAEKTGLAAGPAVGAFIWNQLLRVPWYRSQIMIQAQKQQRKEMIQALAAARIVNDLREGGVVMERRVSSLTSAEAATVLVSQYRVQTRKIPQDLEARRALVKDLAMKKSKGMDRENYEEVISTIIQKQRSVGGNRTAAGAGVTAAVVAGGVMVIPLEDQRNALDGGEVGPLPQEETRIPNNDDPALAASLQASIEELFGKDGIPGNGSKLKPLDAPGSKAKSKATPKDEPTKKKKAKSANKSQKQLETEEDQAELEKMMKSSTVMKSSSGSGKRAQTSASGANAANTGGVAGGTDPPPKKKKLRVKVTRKIPDENGVTRDQVVYVTDPAEVERLLAKRASAEAKAKAASAKSRAAPDSGTPGASSSTLKIAINVRQLSQGGKSKAKNSAAVDRKRANGKKGSSSGTAGGSGGPSIPVVPPKGSCIQTVVDKKGQVGKIKINQKVVRQAQEAQAAKRKRSQYGEDLDYPMRKVPKKSSTSRRKRNGSVTLNGILEEVERASRNTEGYVDAVVPTIHVTRLRVGQRAPDGCEAKNLARPSSTSLDFTKAVDTKATPSYKEVVKKQMYLDLIKHKCKQMKYQTSEEFLDDFKLMVSNAKAFNHTPDVQWVVQHAELLHEVAAEQIEERREDVTAAELQVKKESLLSAAAASAHGGHSRKGDSKKGSKKGKGGSGKEGRSSKDGTPKDKVSGSGKDKVSGSGRSKEAGAKPVVPSSSPPPSVPASALAVQTMDLDTAPFPGGVFGDTDAALPLTELGTADGVVDVDEDDALAMDIAAEMNGDSMF